MNKENVLNTKGTKSISGYLRTFSQKMINDNSAKTDEEKNKKLASIQAKLRAGKKLSPQEMDFLKANDPTAYMHALRIQKTRNSLESALKHARSKQEVNDIISSAMASVSKNDPDKEALLAAISDVADKFIKSSAYSALPATNTEKKKKRSHFEGKICDYADEISQARPSGIYQTDTEGMRVHIDEIFDDKADLDMVG